MKCELLAVLFYLPVDVACIDVGVSFSFMPSVSSSLAAGSIAEGAVGVELGKEGKGAE